VPDVLLIDDNAVQLCVRESVLCDAGLSVARASSGEEAIARLRSFPATVKVIVTDHVMPEANGPSFVRQLREFDPSVPVVVISGMCETEQEYSGLDVTFLQKPCPPDSLIREVRARWLHLA
jgi:CheY-like chemotaxis protein